MWKWRRLRTHAGVAQIRDSCGSGVDWGFVWKWRRLGTRVEVAQVGVLCGSGAELGFMWKWRRLKIRVEVAQIVDSCASDADWEFVWGWRRLGGVAHRGMPRKVVTGTTGNGTASRSQTSCSQEPKPSNCFTNMSHILASMFRQDKQLSRKRCKTS